MFARIENNKVVELLDVEVLPEFHPSLIWMPCDAGVQEGYIYQDGSFNDPADLVTNEEKQLALINYAATKRVAIDNTILIVGDIEVYGDETTRYSIVETLSFLETQDDGTTIDWQAENGFFEVDYDGLQTLGLAIAARRQQSFTAKKAVLSAIDEGMITTTDEIDAVFN